MSKKPQVLGATRGTSNPPTKEKHKTWVKDRSQYKGYISHLILPYHDNIAMSIGNWETNRPYNRMYLAYN